VTLPERGLIAGRYRIERQIGAGGMGSVYLATDTESEQQVALKQAHEGRRPADAKPPSPATCATPNRRLYDSIATEGESWLVMEYVPSRNLATIIADDGPLPAEKVRTSGARSPRRCRCYTTTASCTATSRRATSWSPTTVMRS